MDVYKKKLSNVDGASSKDKRILAFLKSDSTSGSFKALSDLEKKMAHGRKLALLACESYISFNALVSPGFKRFLGSYGAKLEHFPTNRTLLGTALDDVYGQCLKRVKSQIKEECPEFCSISTDGWTDSHLGNSYINYNLIYNLLTEVRTVLVEVAPYDDQKTGKNLCVDLKRVLKEFNILDRQIFIVNDSAANNIKAYGESKDDPELNIIGRIPCIAHNIHNLLYTDIFASKDKEFNSKIKELKRLMSKLSAIHQGCHYKKDEMNDMFKTFCTEEKWIQILSHGEEFSDFDWDNLHFGCENSPPKLKKSNSTRWNSILAMLRSFLRLVQVLNRILCDNNKIHLMITDNEKKTMEELVEIFELFEEAVNVCQVCFIVECLITVSLNFLIIF